MRLQTNGVISLERNNPRQRQPASLYNGSTLYSLWGRIWVHTHTHTHTRARAHAHTLIHTHMCVCVCV